MFNKILSFSGTCGFRRGEKKVSGNSMRVFAAFTSIPGNMSNFRSDRRRPHSCSEWLTMARSTNRASLKEKLQEEFLSCKICLEPFLRPKALPCLHSFCEHCLRDYVRRHPGEKPGHFPCPMCRKDTPIPTGGIQQFQDNFLLLSLSDTLEEDDHWNISSNNNVSNINHHQVAPPKTLAPPTPQEIHLRGYEWYFGKVSRHASEDWLLSPGYPKGTFLVRQGEAAPDTYTLSVRDCDELRGYLVKHYKIHTSRSHDSPISLDCFYITPKRTFRSLNDLVNHYTEVADGLCCKLATSCAKPRSLLWAFERGQSDDYSATRDSILLIKKLGSGQFAEVWLGFGSKEAFEKVQQGYRIPQPEICPQEVYDVILTCWNTTPPSRPSFDFFNTFLHDYLSAS
ncbi:hypothetical protein KUTeg_012654 [Tegillarca granosa]|uniref:Tyrosine-protein kinase n=1 Tax=Tegillarca granosa TaxID=220873 RepID=A0ABQ9F060_TEGGR|nr:hypothetical protein KUTeg_012654 [Tegillarca granosa]